MKRHGRWLLLLCAALLCMPGAAAARAPQGLTLSASHYPAYLAALQIAGDRADVRIETFLQPQAGYLEDFHLSELDWARAQEADLLVLMGGGLEDFLPVFAVEGGKPVLVAGEHIARIPGRVLDPDEDTEPAENPYVWLSPARWGQVVDGVAAGLVHVDAAQAEAWIAANDAAQARIAAVGAALTEALRPHAGRQVIVMHPALAYLAEDAGLSVVLTLERDPALLPLAGDLEDIAQLLAAFPDAVLLLEDTAPASLRGIGGRQTALLDVLCQGIRDGDAQAWERAMRRNIAALTEALR